MASNHWLAARNKESSACAMNKVEKAPCTSSANLRGFLLTAHGQSATPLWEMALLIMPLLWGVRVFTQRGKRKFHVICNMRLTHHTNTHTHT